MRYKIIFLSSLLFLLFNVNAQVCPNETNISNTNVCGLYGDANGNSYWNWELNDPLNSAYCANWYARTSGSGFLVRMGAPWVNAQTGKLKIIADEGDYTKAKGWELLQRKFGCQTDVSNPYFILYNRYTGLMRAYVFIPSQSSQNYQQLLMSIKSVYNKRPATTSDARDLLLAPDKYLNGQPGTASDETVISLGEAVGTNNWAVAEFYMMLDDNITAAVFNNAALEVTMYGVTNNQLFAKVEGTTVTSNDPVKNSAFKTPNASTGGSSFNFTAQGERLIKFSKSMEDFVDGVHKNAEKVATALGTGNSLLGKIGRTAQTVKDNTDPGDDISDLFKAGSGFLGTAGQILKFAGAVSGFFKSGSGSSASPSYTSYNLTVTGTITAQVVVQTFVVKIPGALPAATNSNNATYFNVPLGIFNLQKTPQLDTLAYDRRALLPKNTKGGPSGVPRTIRYTAYKLRENVEVVVNSGAGLTVLSVEGALMAKAVLDPIANSTSSVISIGPLERYPVRGFYTYFNHMLADVEANRLEITHYDVDGGIRHIIQTPFYPLECLNKAVMNIHVPVMKVFLRLRAKLRRADGQGEPIIFVKDYELDKLQGNPLDIPFGIATFMDEMPPYANYTIPPNTNSNLDPLTGTVTGITSDVRTSYTGNVTYSSGGELKANHSISTSLNANGTLANYYTTVNSPTLYTFRAGSSVTLNPKFEATYGSVFLATVDWGNFDAPCYPTALIDNYGNPGNAYNSNVVALKAASDFVGAETLSNTAGKNIYPNPASNLVNIETGLQGKINSLRITDASGKPFDLPFKSIGATRVQIDVSRLQSGSYFARVITANSMSKTFQFVVAR